MTTHLRSPALIQVPTAAWLSGSWNITLFLPPSLVTLATLGRGGVVCHFMCRQ